MQQIEIKPVEERLSEQREQIRKQGRSAIGQDL